MKKLVALLGLVVALVASSVAAASTCPPKNPPRGSRGPCVEYNKYTHVCHPTPGPTGPPVVTPKPVTPPKGDTGPPVSPLPTLNSSEPREGFCVQTAQRGETFVQANVTSFSPQGDWFKLWQSEATVVLDGHTVTLLFEGGKGVILAARVPTADGGYFLTCGQPYVTTDGGYADPKYANR